MTPDQPERNTHAQPGDTRSQLAPGSDQQPLDAAPNSGREGTVIPFPTSSDGQAPLTPEVLEGELIDGPEYVRWPMPVVLPP